MQKSLISLFSSIASFNETGCFEYIAMTLFTPSDFPRKLMLFLKSSYDHSLEWWPLWFSSKVRGKIKKIKTKLKKHPEFKLSQTL
jgi:hypothetical protein